MAVDNFSPKGLTGVREVLERHVDSGLVPGAAIVLARRGEVHVETTGRLAFEGAGATTPMARDTIWRLGSMTKPIAAACVMTLVDDGTLRLDDPVDDLLPELADMRVLADPAGPLADTVPAERPITVQDLLTYTLGVGMVMDESPIAEALDTVVDAPPDEWIRSLGALPLVHQPGERWMYDTAGNVSGVLIARATGMSFGEAVRERVCVPLGMKDTGFHVAARDLDRFSTAYAQEDSPEGEAVAVDGPDGLWSRPATFEKGGGGLVTTADDFLAFTSALLAGGVHNGEQVLARSSVELMTTDRLTPEQKAVSGFWPGYFDAMGWGFGMSVVTGANEFGHSVGWCGWYGLYGTAWYNDPVEDLVAIVIMQRSHAGNQLLPMWPGIWSAVRGAIAD